VKERVEKKKAYQHWGKEGPSSKKKTGE